MPIFILKSEKGSHFPTVDTHSIVIFTSDTVFFNITLSKVQKILRNATRSENTFQSFNIEVYENFFFQLSF